MPEPFVTIAKAIPSLSPSQLGAMLSRTTVRKFGAKTDSEVLSLHVPSEIVTANVVAVVTNMVSLVSPLDHV